MPHIVIEYSKGAGDRVDIDGLARQVHRSVRDCGIVKPNAVRTLAREATISFVADEDPQNQFVQIIVRIAPGRPAELKKAILYTAFEAACDVARPALNAGRFGLRADLIQSDPEFAFQENSLP